jgi:hypothetical protein
VVAEDRLRKAIRRHLRSVSPQLRIPQIRVFRIDQIPGCRSVLGRLPPPTTLKERSLYEIN